MLPYPHPLVVLSAISAEQLAIEMLSGLFFLVVLSLIICMLHLGKVLIDSINDLALAFFTF